MTESPSPQSLSRPSPTYVPVANNVVPITLVWRLVFHTDNVFLRSMLKERVLSQQGFIRQLAKRQRFGGQEDVLKDYHGLRFSTARV